MRKFNGILKEHFPLFLKECEGRFNNPKPQAKLKNLNNGLNTIWADYLVQPQNLCYEITVIENQKHTILVVDDEPGVRDSLSITLNRLGYDVDTSADINSAQEKIESTNYSLVITDLYMPGGSGLDLIIKNTNQKFKVLAISGGEPKFSEENEIPETIFADGFLKKPFTTEELREDIEKLIASQS